MKTTKINIESHCSENWNDMKANKDGRFCPSCQHAVIDFTSKTDAEILAFLEQYKGQRVCGRVNKSQINRPMFVAFQGITNTAMPMRRSSWKAVAMGLSLGLWLAASSITTARNIVLPVSVVMHQKAESEPIDPVKGISGRVLRADNGEPIKGQQMVLYQGNLALATAITDEHGAFSFAAERIQDANLVHWVIATGYRYEHAQQEIIPAKDNNELVFRLKEEQDKFMGIMIKED